MPSHWVLFSEQPLEGTVAVDTEQKVLSEFGRSECLWVGPQVSGWVRRLCLLTSTPFLTPPQDSSLLKHLTAVELDWLTLIPLHSINGAAELSGDYARVGELVWADARAWASVESELASLVRIWPAQARANTKAKWLLHSDDLEAAARQLGINRCDVGALISLTEGVVLHKKLIQNALTRAVRIALRNFRNVCRWPGPWEPWHPRFSSAVKGWPISFLFPFCSPEDRKLIESMLEKWQISLVGHLSLFEPSALEAISAIEDGTRLVLHAHAMAKA